MKEKINLPKRKQQATNPEDERLLRDIYRPDIEKFHLFTRMLRREQLFKKARVTHK